VEDSGNEHFNTEEKVVEEFACEASRRGRRNS
jgi:hypothetical protein